MECYSGKKMTHSPFCHYYHDLKRFRETGELTDVRIEVGEKGFRAHSLILSLASKFFRIMFTNHFREDEIRTVSLENMDKKEFETILDYIYGDKLKISSENAVFLLMACDYLQIKSASTICYRFILDNLKRVNHIFQLYIYLFSSSDFILFMEVRNYIAGRWYELCNCENTRNLSVEILKDLLSLKYLIMNRDEEIFAICENWVMFDLDHRHLYAVELSKILARKCVFEGKYNLLDALSKYTTATPYLKNLHISGETQNLKGLVEITEDEPWFTAIKGRRLKFYRYNGDSWSSIRGYGLTREFDDTLAYVNAAMCYENVFVVAEFKDTTTPKLFYVTNIRSKRYTYLKLPINHYLSNKLNDEIIDSQNNLFNFNETLVFCDDWKIYQYSQGVNKWNVLSATKISRFSPNYACDGNYLFAIGSKCDVNNYQTRMVHKFDHRCKNWFKLAALPKNVGMVASCFYNDNLYVANHEIVYMYDTRSNRWMQIKSSDSFDGRGVSMVRYEQKIYYLQVLNHLSCLDTETRTWTLKPRPLLEWNLSAVNV